MMCKISIWVLCLAAFVSTLSAKEPTSTKQEHFGNNHELCESEDAEIILRCVISIRDVVEGKERAFYFKRIPYNEMGFAPRYVGSHADGRSKKTGKGIGMSLSTSLSANENGVELTIRSSWNTDEEKGSLNEKFQIHRDRNLTTTRKRLTLKAEWILAKEQSAIKNQK